MKGAQLNAYRACPCECSHALPLSTLQVAFGARIGAVVIGQGCMLRSMPEVRPSFLTFEQINNANVTPKTSFF
jgi:hypothetical protein